MVSILRAQTKSTQAGKSKYSTSKSSKYSLGGSLDDYIAPPRATATSDSGSSDAYRIHRTCWKLQGPTPRRVRANHKPWIDYQGTKPSHSPAHPTVSKIRQPHHQKNMFEKQRQWRLPFWRPYLGARVRSKHLSGRFI